MIFVRNLSMVVVICRILCYNDLESRGVLIMLEHEEKNGYDFCGYFSNPEFTGKKSKTITEYPCYRRKKYKIIYKLNKGKNNEYNPKFYFYSTEVNLSSPTRTYYKFLGWYDNLGNKIDKIDKETSGDIVLEARWMHELAYVSGNVKEETKAQPYLKTPSARIKYLSEMIQTQLQFFNLFEAKNTSLATVDTILLTLASLFTSTILIENKSILTGVPNLLLKIGLIVLVCIILSSLVVTLLNIIFDVGTRRKRYLKIKYNHHSISGVIHYNKEEFKNRISTIPPNEVLNDLASQTWGLIRINEKNQKRIKIAVILDLVGLVWFIAILVFVMIAQYI